MNDVKIDQIISQWMHTLKCL